MKIIKNTDIRCFDIWEGENNLKRVTISQGQQLRFVFRAGREYPKECRATRIDIDAKVTRTLIEWI